MNEHILGSMIENVVSALESANFVYKFKKEYTLRDKYFPRIEALLPKTEHVLFRYIAKYEDKWHSVLNTPYLLKNLEFDEMGKDADIVFKCTNIDRNELHEDIRKVPLPKGVDAKAAFLPLQVTLLMIARYYIMTKQTKKLSVICYYYGYSIYWKRFNRQWRYYQPNEGIMTYTINECNNKVLLKRLGSLKELLGHVVQGRFETYIEQMIDFCDEDIRYIADQISTNLGAKIVEVAKKYYDNVKDKNAILKGTSFMEDNETQRLSSSVTSQVEELASHYTTEFFMGKTNQPILKQAALYAKEVSIRELKSTIDTIIDRASVTEVQDFYASLFYIFLTSGDANVSVKAIHSLKFLVVMKNIINKGTSNDKNILRTREIMDKWLEEGSNTFRITTRLATKSNYRKAIYYYFILTITNTQ